jgi:hypothetical protein
VTLCRAVHRPALDIGGSENDRRHEVNRIATAGATGLIVVALTTVSGGARPSAAAGPPGPVAVSETNLDAGGLIRVHEQGVADSRVINLPLDQDGDLRVDGEVEVEGPIDIGNTPTVHVGNTPGVTVTNPLTIERSPARTLVHNRLMTIPSSAPVGPIGLGSDGAEVTAVSLWASSDANFAFGGEALFAIHVEGGTGLVESFDTPLLADALFVECPGGCDIAFSVVGHGG